MTQNNKNITMKRYSKDPSDLHLTLYINIKQLLNETLSIFLHYIHI